MSFPPLKRNKQQLSEEECLALLVKEKRGVLSLCGANGYPYAFPINHYFDTEDKTLYFHTGKIGYKFDCLSEDARACYTITERGKRKRGEWWFTVKSVLAFGEIGVISEPSKISEISRKLSLKFTHDERYIEDEINSYLDATVLLALPIIHLSGKVVKEK